MLDLKIRRDQVALIAELAKHKIYSPSEQNCFYKYVNIGTARLILMNHSMKFSTSNELNDNDLESCLLQQNYSASYIRNEQRKLFNLTLNDPAFKDELKLYNRKAKKNFLHRHPLGIAMKKEFNSKTIVEEHTRAFEYQKNTIGLFCATTSSDKKYMWEHDKYGDSERGFCIEYKFDSLYNELFNAFTVCYDEKMEPLKYLDSKGKLDEVSVHRWLCTKRLQYKNEEEVRFLSRIGQTGIFSVPIQTFTGLYYGKKTPREHIAELELLLKEIGYSFSKATKANY